MTIKLNVQYATDSPVLPDEKLLYLWTKATLKNLQKHAELTIRIVDEDEGTKLNEQWRKSQGSTNVLSFIHEKQTKITANFLGDIVICAPVMEKEAKEQNKNINAHWAHIVIHGVLHLHGFDHNNPKDADRMEQLEIKILRNLHYNNPYLTTPS